MFIIFYFLTIAPFLPQNTPLTVECGRLLWTAASYNRM